MATDEDRRRILADWEKDNDADEPAGECQTSTSLRSIVLTCNSAVTMARDFTIHYAQFVMDSAEILREVAEAVREIESFDNDPDLQFAVRKAFDEISSLMQPVHDGQWALKAREEYIELCREEGGSDETPDGFISDGRGLPHFDKQVDAFKAIWKKEEEFEKLAERVDAYARAHELQKRKSPLKHKKPLEAPKVDLSVGDWSGAVFQAKDLAAVCKATKEEFSEVLKLFPDGTVQKVKRQRHRVRYDLLPPQWREQLRKIEAAANKSHPH